MAGVIGYKDQFEYLYERFAFLEALLGFRYRMTDRGSAGDELSAFRGMVVTPGEMDVLLSEAKNIGGFGGADDGIDAATVAETAEAVVGESVAAGELTRYFQQIEELHDRIDRKTAETLKEGVFLPVFYLEQIFSLTRLESLCLLMSLACEFDGKYERIYGYLHDDITQRYPTVGLAVKLIEYDRKESYSMIADVREDSPFFQYFIELPDAGTERRPLIQRPMKLVSRILDFIRDPASDSRELLGIAEYRSHAEEPEPVIAYEEEYERFEEYLSGVTDSQETRETKRNVLVYLTGPEGIGKRLMVRHFCHEHGMALVLIDLRAALQSERAFQNILTDAVRECVIRDACPCFYHFESLLKLEQQSFFYTSGLLNSVFKVSSLAFLLSECPWNERQLVGNDTLLVNFKLDMPNDRKKVKLWEQMAIRENLIDQLNIIGAANKFRFTPAQIQKALSDTCSLLNREREHSLLKPEDGAKANEDLFYQACYNQISHGLEKKSVQIEPVFSWDDLILPDDSKVVLRAACAHIQYKNVVYGQWGFDQKVPYGRGLSVLFSGPPGTGKTMGAQVMAKELHLKMYKVDLSQIISKYIGETERNLKEVFDEAALSNAILFFDEADALFGKRTNVKDSHDKYANVETSFLLQKIEEYDGVSILASNFMQNIDEAFLRRLTFIVKFPFPEEEDRRKIWMNVFPKDASLSGTVNYDYLARNFELSGSNIKSVALAASFLAASENSSIGMSQLVRCVRRELGKGGRVVLKEQFGEYVGYLSDGF